MNFSSNHYVPILKVKPAESEALKHLSPDLYKHITPLFEIVERKGDPAPELTKHIETALKRIHKSAHLFRRCFLDVRELEPDGHDVARTFFERALSAGINFTPVTGISRTVDVDAAKAFPVNGLAIRITKSDIDNGNLSRTIASFLKAHSLTPENIDLIIDLGPVDDRLAEGVSRLTDEFLSEIPFQTSWRTFTLSGCAFPKSMGILQSDTFKLLDRSEWMAWLNDLFRNRHTIQRLPTFSDCAIQYPTGVEGIDFSIVRPAPSIRYTLENEWLLLKGEGGQTQQLHTVQYPFLATRLTRGDLRSHYLGPEHCAGCKLMNDCSEGTPRLGSSGAWRRLGTIHHITMVVNRLVSLPWT